MRNTAKQQSRRNTRKEWHVPAALQTLEGRSLFSVTLTGLPTTSLVAETGGVYNTNSYLAVSGSKQNSFYQGWGALEFGSSSAVFPKTYTVSDVDSMSLSLYNTATTGGYAGHPGNFDVYFMPDDATALTSARFQTSDVHGLAGQFGTSASTDAGTATFDNSVVGYQTFNFSSLPTAVKQGIVNDLNTGQAIRLAVVPDSASFAADWEGNYTSKQPTLTITAEQSPAVVEQVGFTNANYTANEQAGTATVTVTRTGSSIADAASVQYETSDGNAIAGTNYTATSGTLHFAAGQSTATIAVPVTNVANQGGNKALTLILSNPDTAGAGYVHVVGSQSSAVLTIVDSVNTASNTETLNSAASNVSTIEASGPYSTTYLNVEGSANKYAAFGSLDFNDSTAGNVLTPSKTVTAINSVTLNLTQGYPAEGSSGPMAVYLVSDATTDTSTDGSSPLVFSTSDLPDGVGDQLGTKSLLGSFNWDATVPGDTSVPASLIQFNAATEATLISDINSGTKFRLVVTPQNPTVFGSFEGNYTYNGTYEGPQVSINVTEGSTAGSAQLPGYITPSADAVYSYDPSSGNLSVTHGQLTFTADSSTDTVDKAINLTVSGAGTSVAFNTTQHLAGLTLSNGAAATMTSFGASRTSTNHSVLVIGSLAGATTPTFSIDASSKLDLADNDLIIHNGNLASAVASAAEGRNPASGAPGQLDGQWNGNGLTSSAAASVDANAGYEQNALAVVRNGDMLSGGFSTFDNEAVGANDVIVKYTYVGDLDLDGKVDANDSAIFSVGFDGGASANNPWSNGDTNGDGLIDANDSANFSIVYGNGVAGSGLSRL